MPGHPTVCKSCANYKSIIILTLVKAYKLYACGNVYSTRISKKQFPLLHTKILMAECVNLYPRLPAWVPQTGVAATE